jgi:DNA-binding NtrC family response regulator
MRVFWLGQDAPQRYVTPDALSDLTFQQFARASEAISCLTDAEPDAVVVRYPLPDCAPAELLELIQNADDVVPVIVCDPDAALPDIVRMVKLGAYYCFNAECTPAQLTEVLRAAVEDRRTRQLIRLSHVLVSDRWKRYLIGESPAMKNVERIVRLAGPRRCTVLITGETGTGKEMAARALHMAGNRAQAAFVALNCSAIPENLLETELFGHAKGAFTGATAQRTGRFEQAHGGTLFLDEIGDMPFDLQSKLLRVLQEREFQRVGSSETIRVDVRVIAASNLNLAERVKENKFREDLYYRLNVVPLQMPPLRARASDIPALVYHFIEKICKAEDLPVKKIHRDTMDRLCGYDWPGNVRQLENAVEMAVIMSDIRDTLYVSDFNLPGGPALPSQPVFPMLGDGVLPDHGLDLESTMVHFERNIVQQALQRAGGNKTLAADMLRIPRTTLISKLRALESARV